MFPEFPIKVRAKDSGEIIHCKDIYEMQHHFEKIDIENSEYEAWNAEGRPVKMSVQKPV